MSEHFIEEKSLSLAWGRAVRTVSEPGRKELAPLIVTITGFDAHDAPVETPSIRGALDAFLAANGRQSVETVASTIFPYHMRNQGENRQTLYDRYLRILPRLRAASNKNRHGIYFERIITGGPDDHPNQLEFVIAAYCSRNEVRRSMLQIGVFNPKLDVTSAALRGFPCLQHITLAPVGETLTVNAFYATQYMVERAYGNYLGLCRLAKFAAKEMNLRLSRVTCYSGIAMLDGSKGKLASILSAVNQATPVAGAMR